MDGMAVAVFSLVIKFVWDVTSGIQETDLFG